MTVFIALLLVTITVLALAQPWLQPRAKPIAQPGPKGKGRRSRTDMEAELEIEIMRRRQARGASRPATDVCSSCGAQHAKEARFCPNCGAKL